VGPIHKIHCKLRRQGEIGAARVSKSFKKLTQFGTAFVEGSTASAAPRRLGLRWGFSPQRHCWTSPMSTGAAGGNGATLAGGNRNYDLPRNATGLLLPWERSVAAMES